MTYTRMYVLFLVLLISQLPTNAAISEPPVKIGFTCCNFYNPSSGTPVFAPGEDMWLMAEQNLSAVLKDPNGGIISRNMPANSSARFYTFREEDQPGRWTLDIRGKAGEFPMPIYLAHLQTNASLTSMTYNLTDTELSMRGTLTTETAEEGGILLLVRNDQATSVETNQVPFLGGFLQAHISWNPDNPRKLSITPFASGTAAPNMSSVWAEVSSEIALLKQVGGSKVITLVPQIVTRTNHETMNITSQPQQSLEVDLPLIHQVGFNGQVPLRMGAIRLTVFLQIEGIIYSLEADTFLLRNAIAPSIASMAEIPPLQNPISFDLTDDLQRVSGYDLFFVGKESGVSVVWDKTIIPPVTRLQVLNTLTNETIDNYQITSDQIQEVAKVGPQTFVIPRVPERNAELNLRVGGLALQTDDFTPNSTKLEPLSTVQIETQASDAHLLIEDALGNTPLSGTIRLMRIVGATKTETSLTSWNTSSGFINLTLPVGQYEIELTTEGSTVASHFSVSHSSEFITLTFTELFLIESRNGLILTGIVSLIIVIEALSAFRLWKPLVIRRRNKTP